MILLITILSLSNTYSSYPMRDGTMNRLLISIYCLEGIAYTAFDNDNIYQFVCPP
jgi:hypothetical protein